MKLYLRLALIVCLVVRGFVSCRKDNSYDPIVLSQSITGNIITLKWEPVDESGLTGYYITRSDSFGVIKSFTTDANTTTLVDTIPMAPSVTYSVVSTITGQGQGHMSNVIRITRTDMALADINPFDALYDQGSQQIYVYSKEGNMQVYDVNAKKWVRNASWGSGVGYCDLGVYNGKTELYVPREDGWLFIYDAATLTKLDQINIGTKLYSVNYNNGILYVCGEISTSAFDYSIVSYNREYKMKIAQRDMSDENRLRLVPGSNSEFFGCIYSGYLRSYKFDGNGNFVSQVSGTATGTYPVPKIFEVFPDGNKLISNSTGCIYSKTLAYETVLPHGGVNFTSFCFDNAAQLIYAGCKEKKVQAYAMSNYQLAKTMSTQGIPFKVFFSNGSVICVSTAPVINGGYYGMLSSTTFVEMF